MGREGGRVVKDFPHHAQQVVDVPFGEMSDTGHAPPLFLSGGRLVLCEFSERADPPAHDLFGELAGIVGALLDLLRLLVLLLAVVLRTLVGLSHLVLLCVVSAPHGSAARKAARPRSVRCSGNSAHLPMTSLGA